MKNHCYSVEVTVDANIDLSDYNRTFGTLYEATDWAYEISSPSDYDEEIQKRVNGVWVSVNMCDYTDPDDPKISELSSRYVKFW
jgi:hypothetical protein